MARASARVQRLTEDFDIISRFRLQAEVDEIIAAVDLPGGCSLLLETFGHRQLRSIGLMTLAGGGAVAALIGIFAVLGSQAVSVDAGTVGTAASAPRIQAVSVSQSAGIAMAILFALAVLFTVYAVVQYRRGAEVMLKMRGSLLLMARLIPAAQRRGGTL